MISLNYLLVPGYVDGYDLRTETVNTLLRQVLQYQHLINNTSLGMRNAFFPRSRSYVRLSFTWHVSRKYSLFTRPRTSMHNGFSSSATTALTEKIDVSLEKENER